MSETILIVDKAPPQLRLTEYIVRQKLHYHIITVGGGADAIQWVRCGKQPPPDLMMLDLHMPGVEGLQVLREVKACKPQLPVIVIIPYGNEDYVVQAVRAGADDFLTKPVLPERLKISIHNTLQLQRMSNYISCLERRITGNSEFSGNVDQDTPVSREGLAQETSPSPYYVPRRNMAVANVPALLDMHGRIKTLKSIENEAIRFALNSCGGCMTRAARNLGIGRSTLYRRVSELGAEEHLSRENHAMRPMIKMSSGERS